MLEKRTSDQMEGENNEQRRSKRPHRQVVYEDDEYDDDEEATETEEGEEEDEDFDPDEFEDEDDDDEEEEMDEEESEEQLMIDNIIDMYQDYNAEFMTYLDLYEGVLDDLFDKSENAPSDHPIKIITTKINDLLDYLTLLTWENDNELDASAKTKKPDDWKAFMANIKGLHAFMEDIKKAIDDEEPFGAVQIIRSANIKLVADAHKAFYGHTIDDVPENK